MGKRINEYKFTNGVSFAQARKQVKPQLYSHATKSFATFATQVTAEDVEISVKLMK